MAIENPSAPAVEATNSKGSHNTKPVLRKAQVEIVDIRADREEYNILEEIKRGLRPEDGNLKTLPTLLLYDAEGLRLFERITYLQEYYLTNTEIELLEKYATSIAEKIKPGSIVVELGSGNLRKIEILLNALEKAEKNVEYYALDLSLVELQRTLEAISTEKYRHVKCRGLHGTYDDGLEWLKSEQHAGISKAVLSMGSSIGNFKKAAATGFLESFASILRPGDSMIIGIDACKDPRKVFHAYNDIEGTTHQFILNGLEHANQLLGSKQFNIEDWKVIGEYRYGEEGGRHMAFVSPTRDVTIDGVLVRKDERLQIEESNKFSSDEASQMFRESGLIQGIRWTNDQGDYALHMAYKPSFSFPSQPNEYARNPVPSLEDWNSLWTVWDIVTKHMIPQEELLEKPINLRNACIFYLGHIPTFLDIHLSRATGDRPKELDYYQLIFERGIDPDVDNPELCHDHSEVPETWPPIDQILQYQDDVRTRVKNLLQSLELSTNGHLRKAMWLGFEHEAMHLETLLYMLVQSEKTLPPVSVLVPDFQALASETTSKKPQNSWASIPERHITIGINDPDKELQEVRYFGWDNEKPTRAALVKAFEAKERPITNREYAEYLQSTGIERIPASWISTNSVTNGHSNGQSNGHVNGHTNGDSNGFTNRESNGSVKDHSNGSSSVASYAAGKAVRTVFGQVPLQFALDWPVMASYDEIAGCASWMGGRIPTMEEVRSIYDHVEEQKSKEVENRSENIPAVNSHLVNDGVEESPPQAGNDQRSSSNGARSITDPNNLFINLQNANVGFKSWHPTALAEGQNLAGQGEFGGVWEWTSSVLEKHAGFEPMELYPGYTADFFDGKHNIVLGGSWATHPRLAGRKSFVNWYQRNYPYVWAGARLVRDL